MCNDRARLDRNGCRIDEIILAKCNNADFFVFFSARADHLLTFALKCGKAFWRFCGIIHCIYARTNVSEYPGNVYTISARFTQSWKIDVIRFFVVPMLNYCQFSARQRQFCRKCAHSFASSPYHTFL